MTEGEDRRLWGSPALVPSLAYEDVPAAIEWLCRAFGFRERTEARLFWPGGSMAWIELGDALINITSPGDGLESPKATGQVGHHMKVYVDDVDTHFEDARRAGAAILSEPEDGFWDGRIYRAADLEGHIWEFSQAGLDLDARDWRLPPGLERGAPR